MKKILLGIILVAIVLFASNQNFIKHSFAQWDNSWNNTNGDCPSCVYWCPDGVHQYYYSQSECPSTQQPQPQQQVQYNWCPDGYHQYLYSQSECPTSSTMTYQPYTPTPYITPVYNYPTTYTQPSYNYPIYNYPTYPTQPQQPSYQCWNGTWVYNLSQCPVQTQTCQNGDVIPMTQSCPKFYCAYNGNWYLSQSDYNNLCKIQYQTCPNGVSIPINQTCPNQYQVCWNGATVLANQQCPPQYQTCWNGTVIPVSQTCPVKTITTVIIKNVEIRTHSVVTNLATQVGATSAVCNGTALISSKMSSVGWFEYGTTVNLGNTTNSANIGSDETSNFSNLITGLKPGTTYYCRAVMSNADGTYKGKIVSFTTIKDKKVVYATPTKKPTVKPKTKTEFVCSDGSLAVARTVLVADTINSGGKLISINIERNNPDLVQGKIVNYRITITNNADTAVTGVEEKIVLPTEMSFVDATTTGGITIKENIMTVPIGNLNAKEVKTFILPAKVANDAQIGKAIMTTVYVSYNLPVTGSTVVKDEVSSYMVANVVSADGTKSTDSNGKSSSLASILFPQTLLGWLVLFAIILIIIVLVMNINKWIKDRKKEKEEHAIHHHIA
ncbi:MAG: hypothetical protein U0469_02530 [Candidatus Paceibacterota bacterium]|jgi:uncharacterized repeat protein (TIGR01451 family)